jgi:hypothetical protein
VGGGHRKANPKAGRKGPRRGDKRREEVAGRKRIASASREKATSPIPMTEGPTFEEFLPRERNIIYTLAKRKAIGHKRPQELDSLVRIQRVTDEEREDFVSGFKRKGEARGWLIFYVDGDGIDQVYINPDDWGTVRTYLDMSEP